MTNAEIDALGPKLQARCNAEIAERFPLWSRYAVDTMLNRTMDELAPDWVFTVMSTINGRPGIRLTQYIGDVE